MVFELLECFWQRFGDKKRCFTHLSGVLSVGVTMCLLSLVRPEATRGIVSGYDSLDINFTNAGSLKRQAGDIRDPR